MLASVIGAALVSFRATMGHMKVLDTLTEDFAASWGCAAPSKRHARVIFVVSRFFSLRGLPIGLYRLSHVAGRYSGVLGTLFKALNQIINGCDIGHRAEIGPGLRMPHPVGVVIHSDARIGARFTIHSCALVGATPYGAPVIGDDVNMAPGARISGPITLDNRVRVAMNAVVTKTFPGEGLVLAGVPARVSRVRRDDE